MKNEMDENYVDFLVNEFNTCSLKKLEKYHADYESENVSPEFIFAWEKWLSGGNFIR